MPIELLQPEIIFSALAAGAALITSGWLYFRSRKKPYDKASAPKLPPVHPDITPVPSPTPEPQAIETIPAAQEISTPTLEQALSQTRKGLFGKLKAVFASSDLSHLEQIEEVLYTSDIGPRTVERLMESLREKSSKKELLNFDFVRDSLKDEIKEIVLPVHTSTDVSLDNLDPKLKSGDKPRVWMIVGVNGAGKTTSVGKLSGWASQQGLKVMIGAGDTFRAAAGEQLEVWSQRANVEIFAPENIDKPSAVAFEATQKALTDKKDLLILDTAGRLHTQANLMEELKKVKRVIEKVLPGAPHEVLLVLDANMGQNALVQARQFHEALQVTGVILTKLDGTAKGGVVIGLANELQIPVKAIGVGERLADLKPFSPNEFVDSIL